MDRTRKLLSDWHRNYPAVDVCGMAIVGRVLGLAAELTARTEKLIRKYSICYTDFDVLATLYRQGPPYELMPSELGKSVLISSGAMTTCLDRLESKNLITRRPSETDRRSLFAGLTTKGVDLAETITGPRFEDAKEGLDQFTSDEKNLLESLLDRYLETLQNAGAPILQAKNKGQN